MNKDMRSRIFRKNFTARVHQLIKTGYNAMEPGSCTRAREPEITGDLAAAIQAALCSPDAPDWSQFIAVKENPPVNDGIRRGNKRKMPDLVFELTLDTRPQFAFEAKRLSRPHHPVSNYIGSTGMGCFLNGDYAIKEQEAGMLGYVQSHDPTVWHEQLKFQFDPDTTHDLQTPWAFPHEFKSTHVRFNNTPIVLYHILLNFN